MSPHRVQESLSISSCQRAAQALREEFFQCLRRGRRDDDARNQQWERIRIMQTAAQRVSSKVSAKQIWLTAMGLALITVAAPSDASAQLFRGWGFLSPSPPPSWATPYPYDGGCASGSCGTQRPMPMPTTSWSPTYGYGYGMWNGASQPVGTARPVYQVPVTPQRPVTRSGGNVESPYYTYQEGQASIRRTPVTVQPARRQERPAVNPPKVDSPYYP